MLTICPIPDESHWTCDATFGCYLKYIQLHLEAVRKPHHAIKKQALKTKQIHYRDAVNIRSGQINSQQSTAKLIGWHFIVQMDNDQNIYCKGVSEVK